MNDTFIEINGKWQPAKEVPYQPYGIGAILCALGFHEMVGSNKYAHTRYCFRCGKRKTDKSFDY